MISLSGVGMRFGAQVLFEDVSWQLQPGGHYGLVGANGAGKSTLLRMMAGETAPENGIIARPNGLALGTLGQDHFQYDGDFPLQVVISGNPRLGAALEEKQRLLDSLDSSAGPDEASEASVAIGSRLAELEAAIADAGGYDAEARAGALLEGLGLAAEKHNRPMDELSGGYRLRVLLARTLFAEPDLLLLDEPTNHLDIDSIRWLESYLRAFAGIFVVVSHDRHFLNAICSQIADLDYGEMQLYPGNYDAFLAAKELAVRQKDTEIARAEEKIAEMQKFIDRFKAKATKARQAQSRKKQVERMEMPEIKRSSRRHPAFVFSQNRPSGREVLAVESVTKRYGDHTVLDKVSFSLQRGEKLAVVGPNGIGKSTLLKIIAGQMEADAGAALPGYEAHIGYFAQDHRELLSGKASVYEWLQSMAPGETVGTIRGILGKALFSGDDVEKSLPDLSGGESARLLLSGLMVKRDNLLVLDEPTNHLDLEGREALMDALRDYEGSLIFVSHDRHFVSSVGKRVLVLSPQGVEDIHGNYEDYLARQGQDFFSGGERTKLKAVKAERKKSGQTRENTGKPGSRGGDANLEFHDRKERKRSLSRLQKRVAGWEREIVRLEEEMAGLDRRFAGEGYFDQTPWEQVKKEQGKKDELQRQLSAAMAEWESASEDMEALQPAS